MEKSLISILSNLPDETANFNILPTILYKKKLPHKLLYTVNGITRNIAYPLLSKM